MSLENLKKQLGNKVKFRSKIKKHEFSQEHVSNDKKRSHKEFQKV